MFFDLIFQGNLRIWKYPLPEGFDAEDDMGTYYRLPSFEPINVMVRVYVIRVSTFHCLGDFLLLEP